MFYFSQHGILIIPLGQLTISSIRWELLKSLFVRFLCVNSLRIIWIRVIDSKSIGDVRFFFIFINSHSRVICDLFWRWANNRNAIAAIDKFKLNELWHENVVDSSSANTRVSERFYYLWWEINDLEEHIAFLILRNNTVK